MKEETRLGMIARAQAAKKAGVLDQFLSDSGLSPDQQEELKGFLFAREAQQQPAATPSQAGIYSHYLSHVKKKFVDGHVVAPELNRRVRGTARRLRLRDPRVTHSEKRPGYGLVIGMIQSGKTAHMLGLALHSIDPDKNKRPVDTVIVLSGLVNDLRLQTRKRFSSAINGFEGVKPEILPRPEVDLKKTDDEKTKEEIKKHFSSDTGIPLIIVIKKNHLVLGHLLDCIKKMPKTEAFGRRILIIDDEADHASVDTGLKSDADHSDGKGGEGEHDDNPNATNRALRDIIRCFEKSELCWYIGYTATPFANLLSNTDVMGVTSTHGRSLHPRDMLHALGKSEGHLDNTDYFLKPNSTSVKVIDSLPIPFSNEEAEEMRRVILRHVITKWVKTNRGLEEHHTTLVHTSRDRRDHKRIAELLRAARLHLADPDWASETKSEMGLLVKEYNLPVAESGALVKGLVEKVGGGGHRKFRKLLNAITVVEVNRRPREEGENSPEELDYSDTRTRSYIAVGGYRLSRGLTLEGLTTSWFSRSAKKPRYDTMLQMARWCGYRTSEGNDGDKVDYSNLVRILTTEQIRQDFRNISIEEDSLRTKIMGLKEDADPMSEFIWIREHPGMKLTRPEAMQYAKQRVWGDLKKSVLWSYDSPVLRESPKQSSEELYKSLLALVKDSCGFGKESEVQNRANFHLLTAVPMHVVKRFIQSYHNLLASGEDCKTADNLHAILSSEWDKKWNVGIHTPDDKKQSIDIGKLNVGYVNRSTTVKGAIKVIWNSMGDTRIDLEDVTKPREKPLLLVYLVDPASTQNDEGEVPIFDKEVTKPVPIFGICLPNESSGEGGVEWTADK